MGAFFPVVNSTLSAEAFLKEVLSDYDIGSAESCKLLYIGVNDTYIVTTTEGKRYILRAYRAGWRTLENILYEIDALCHLDKSGVPVSIPLPNNNGEFVCSVEAPEGRRYIVLFTYAEGQEPKYDNRIQAIHYGMAVARIHSATDDFRSIHSRFSIDIEHLIISSLKTIEPFLRNRKQDWDYLKNLSERLISLLTKLPLDKLDKGFCHGDLHGWNTNIDDHGTVTLYDFDCCGMGWRAYDVAVFRWSSRIRDTEKELWPAYLEGYRKYRRLNELDLLAVPLFIPIRQIWMMGLNASIAKVFGDSWVNDSYFDRELRFIRQCETEYINKE